MNKELNLYFNDYDWFIAYDEEDAWLLWSESSGEKRKDYDHELFWNIVPKDKILRFYDECTQEKEKGTSKYFIEKYGRGFLMSTEW